MSTVPQRFQKALNAIRADLAEICRLFEKPVLSLNELGSRPFRDLKNIFRDQVFIYPNTNKLPFVLFNLELKLVISVCIQ